MPDNNIDTNGWPQWSRYVLTSIKEIKELRDVVNQFRVELAVLRIKVAFWGAVGAILGTTLGTLVIQIILHVIKDKVGGMP
jgi:hypothetical protein